MLNAHYAALRVVSVRRAFTLLVKQDAASRPVAEVVHVEDGRFVSYGFEDWTELSAFKREIEPFKHDWLRTVRFDLVVPRIIRVLTFARLPRREVKFNRRNIFARDNHTCQYCGHRFGCAELSLDHVVPRTQGGGTSWENVVTACLRCNVRKGGRTPEEANLRLPKVPIKPKRHPSIRVRLADDRYETWKHFLDRAAWAVDLS